MCGVSSLWRLDKEVGGALIPNSMQRVCKCKLVGFCRAAARRRAAKISRSPFRRFLIAKGIRRAFGVAMKRPLRAGWPEKPQSISGEA